MGGAIDAKLKQLEKSGDIDWATSKFGGEVAGELVVGDAVIAGIVGKATTLVRAADKAADAARIAETGRRPPRAGPRKEPPGAASHLDDTVKLPPFEPPPGTSHLDDTQRFPPFEPPGSAVDDVAGAGRTPVTKPTMSRAAPLVMRRPRAARRRKLRKYLMPAVRLSRRAPA